MYLLRSMCAAKGFHIMYYNDGELMYHDLEMRRRDLIREAKMERLARKAQEKPSHVQSGWMRLIADLMHSSTMRVKRQARIAGPDDSSILIDSQDKGLETI
jgi:hypothetical protein